MTDTKLYHRVRRLLDMGQASLTGPLRMALVTGYTPDLESHNTWDQISSHEISADNYAPGGRQIQGSALSRTGAVTQWTTSPVVWQALTAVFDHAVIYQDDAGQELVAVMVFTCGDEVSLHMQDLQVRINMSINVAPD